MIKLLYYLFGLFFAYHKHKMFFQIPELIKSKRYIKTEEEKKTIVIKKYSELSPENKEIFNIGMISILFSLWMIVGLFTFNWLYYVFVILIGHFIVNPIILHNKENIKFHLLVLRIYIFVTWMLCIFVIANTYYFNFSSNDMINLIADVWR